MSSPVWTNRRPPRRSCTWRPRSRPRARAFRWCTCSVDRRSASRSSPVSVRHSAGRRLPMPRARIARSPRHCLRCWLRMCRVGCPFCSIPPTPIRRPMPLCDSPTTTGWTASWSLRMARHSSVPCVWSGRSADTLGVTPPVRCYCCHPASSSPGPRRSGAGDDPAASPNVVIPQSGARHMGVVGGDPARVAGRDDRITGIP